MNSWISSSRELNHKQNGNPTIFSKNKHKMKKYVRRKISLWEMSRNKYEEMIERYGKENGEKWIRARKLQPSQKSNPSGRDLADNNKRQGVCGAVVGGAKTYLAQMPLAFYKARYQIRASFMIHAHYSPGFCSQTASSNVYVLVWIIFLLFMIIVGLFGCFFVVSCWDKMLGYLHY